MSQIKQITVYSFNELSPAAKEKALYDNESIGDYPWSTENKNSLYKFAEVTGTKVTSYEYGGQRNDHVTWKSDYSDEVLNLSGIRLLSWLHNNVIPYISKGKYYSTKGHYDENKQYHYKHRYSKCQFTYDDCPLSGYCMDNSILWPIYEFIKVPGKNTTLEDLLNDCYDSWLKSCTEDMRYYFSEESFKDMCEANNWTFTESGEMENI